MITHIVLFWTDKGDEAGKEAILQGAKELLSTIPGVQNLRVGGTFPSPRGVVDDTFGAAICMDFESMDALQIYQDHTQHIAFVTDYVKKHSRRMVVYDIES